MNISSFFSDTFSKNSKCESFAPGRIEFIGNHTDYNGGNVLGVATTEGISAAGASRNDNKICLISTASKKVYETSLDSIKAIEGDDNWVNYPLGVLKCLIDKGMTATSGFEIAYDSNLPVGAGLSSSAAMELSTAYILTKLFDFPLDKKALAQVSRKAENEFVGVPCGILDQGVSAHGEENQLVFIDCDKEFFDIYPFSQPVNLWVFNTHSKHSLVDSLYSTRHTECMNAVKILKKDIPSLKNLCELNKADWEKHQHALTGDIEKRAEHIIFENERVKDVVKLLGEKNIELIGKNLHASHLSSQNLFENSTAELDFLVENLMAQPNVLGARLSGGGFGGASMAMTTANYTTEQAEEIQKKYTEKFGHPVEFFMTKPGKGARLTSSK